MGGLYAGTTAASDSRITAVCINGAPAHPRLLGMRTLDDQACAMLGTTDPSEVQRDFDRIALQPGDHIEAPLLVLHGGADPIVSLDDQQPFLDAATPGRAELRVWDDGRHVIINHAEERNARRRLVLREMELRAWTSPPWGMPATTPGRSSC